MVPNGTATVVSLDAGGRRARREFDALIVLARAELEAIAAGDLEAFWGVHRAINQALCLMLEHRLDAA